MTFNSSSRRSTFLSCSIFAVALILGTLLPHRLSAQNAVLVYGSSSGVPQVVKSTTNALWVSLQGGVPPSLTAGSGTGAFKPSGNICDTAAGTCSCTTFADASVQNQWNVITCTIPASTLIANGDLLEVAIDWKLAANANTKEYQSYFNGGTCSGSGAAMCSTGTQFFALTSTGSGTSVIHRFRATRTASNTQRLSEFTSTANSLQDTFTTTAAVTDTGTIPFAFGVRNQSAAATSVGNVVPQMTITLSPQ